VNDNDWCVVSILTASKNGDHNTAVFVNVMARHRLDGLQAGVPKSIPSHVCRDPIPSVRGYTA
jgi:hypothetical protein